LEQGLTIEKLTIAGKVVTLRFFFGAVRTGIEEPPAEGNVDQERENQKGAKTFDCPSMRMPVNTWGRKLRVIFFGVEDVVLFVVPH
jgi:hypothetical protein